MAIYINWMQTSQVIKGDVLPTEGSPVENHVVATSGAATDPAPVGTHYASVWSDSNATVSVSEFKGLSLGAAKTYALPALTVLQVPNIIPGVSTITVTDL